MEKELNWICYVMLLCTVHRKEWYCGSGVCVHRGNFTMQHMGVQANLHVDIQSGGLVLLS